MFNMGKPTPAYWSVSRKFINAEPRDQRRARAADERARLAAAGFKDAYRFPLADRAAADAMAKRITDATGVAMSINEAADL
jgi:hypothetical protein